MQALSELVRAAGAKPGHERRVIVNWLAGRALDARLTRGDAAFPAALVAALPNIAAHIESMARVESEHVGADGSIRLLVRLADGQSVETVLLERDSLCVSTQVGCAVGCTFCMTGRDGLVRSLSSFEIVAQVALARRRRSVRRVVFMGMGEPAHNLERVLEAVAVLAREGGIGHKELVISSVGDRRLFERLARATIRPALALSLHTTKPALRAELLPRAPRIDPSELVALADVYARASGHPIQYQWTLLAGVNDGDDEIDGIERLLAGRHGILNFIPYNAVDGLAFGRPSIERMRALSQDLHRRGILVKLRRSAAQDIDGACGQLRARARVGSA